jgi:ABC-type cobalamin/Fe3+-siderophores transport system ATPase subunit
MNVLTAISEKAKERIKAKYDIHDYSEPDIPIPEKPEDGLVLLVGPSGSGKSTIIRNWFDPVEPVFGADELIDDFSSVNSAEKYLLACGLRSIPAWFRSYRTLSVGEAHRAYCAKALDMGSQYIDEFSSVVDRNTAKSLANSIKKHHEQSGGLLVVATCHRDILQWLQPDKVYDTAIHEYRARECVQRPSITMEIYPCKVQDWIYFKNHHYLSTDIARSCHCYIGLIEGEPVAFSAVIHGCGRDIRSYWRESRLVVKPEFQGFGLGKAMSEAVGDIYLNAGKRFFSKTAHPALGRYRNSSPKWRGTSTNGQSRPSYITKGDARVQKGFGKKAEHIIRDASRVCFSHEYMGNDG